MDFVEMTGLMHKFINNFPAREFGMREYDEECGLGRSCMGKGNTTG